ncbi:MAG TPA: HAMP domain-containing protein [Pseudomonadota bacterium]|jgi:HAMP domain-containing protein|nr:HAMP domain-containing protein [Pseudomonadota bacterium]
MIRLPLPVKLFLSYLGVLLLGAGPTFFYIRVVLHKDLLRESVVRMAEQIQKLGEALRSVSENDRETLMRRFGALDTHRLTFLSLAGDVRLDTGTVRPLLTNHAQRPEVKMAMGDPLEKPQGLPVWENLSSSGFGYARRHSETLGSDTVYVAKQLVDEKNQPYGVLRLSSHVDSIDSATRGTMRFLLNAMAGAVSAAILFSLVSAVFFVRPLRRVSAMAQSLGSGDLGVKVLRPGNDEVGDVARVLNQMATELRQRLLSAGTGEALLSQLVEALPCACVIFEENGQLVACNGAGRRALSLSGSEADARLAEFAEHPQVKTILKTAENEGQAEPVRIELQEGQPVTGLLHVLKRPGLAPLRAFLGLQNVFVEGSLLPSVEDIAPRLLSELLSDAEKQAQQRLLRVQKNLDVTWEGMSGQPSQLSVAEADGRLLQAVTEILCAFSQDSAGSLSIGVATEPLRVRLHFDTGISPQTLSAVRPLVEPLGGEVESTALETKLWLPRA